MPNADAYPASKRPNTPLSGEIYWRFRAVANYPAETAPHLAVAWTAPMADFEDGELPGLRFPHPDGRELDGREA